MADAKRKKIRFDKVHCEACEEPTEYRVASDGVLYVRCHDCGGAIKLASQYLGKEVIWLDREVYEAERRKKESEDKANVKQKT